MKTKHLGNSGLEVSSVGMGCMNLGMMCDQHAANAIIGAALSEGVNFFDVADIYGSGEAESMLAKALGSHRKEIVLATKFGAKTGGRGGAAENGGSRSFIMNAVESSLKKLNTDYIDLYQYHFPDSTTPIEETLRALNDLVQQGKVRYIGCSNFSGKQLDEAHQVAADHNLHGFVSAQNRYSLLFRGIEQELVPVAEQHDISILPFFPLESGLLTGKYRRDDKPAEGTRFAKWGGGGGFVSDERYSIVESLEAYGQEIGRSVLDLAIGWLAAQPFVASVIAGVTSPEQIRQNVAAASWNPSPEQLNQISAISGSDLVN